MGKKRKKKKVLLSGSDPFYLSKKLRRRRYGEVSAQTSQKSQNRAFLVVGLVRILLIVRVNNDIVRLLEYG